MNFKKIFFWIIIILILYLVYTYIFSDQENISNLELWLADLDYNNSVNVQDVLILINQILNS